eukprot:scaffold21819_cov65-Phaeocystis_antarctica.AAC.6
MAREARERAGSPGNRIVARGRRSRGGGHFAQPAQHAGALAVGADDQPRRQGVARRHIEHNHVAKVDGEGAVPRDAP